MPISSPLPSAPARDQAVLAVRPALAEVGGQVAAERLLGARRAGARRGDRRRRRRCSLGRPDAGRRRTDVSRPPTVCTAPAICRRQPDRARGRVERPPGGGCGRRAFRPRTRARPAAAVPATVSVMSVWRGDREPLRGQVRPHAAHAGRVRREQAADAGLGEPGPAACVQRQPSQQERVSGLERDDRPHRGSAGRERADERASARRGHGRAGEGNEAGRSRRGRRGRRHGGDAGDGATGRERRNADTGTARQLDRHCTAPPGSGCVPRARAVSRARRGSRGSV